MPAMSESAAQLPLAVQLRDEATFDNFLFFGELGALRSALDLAVEQGGESFIFLHGPPGSGCSHLLQAACQALPSGQALYLPLAQLTEMPAEELLADVEQMQLVCLDNLEAITGKPEWEQAMFNLCNRARAEHCRLLFAASQSPRNLQIALPDLQSRLAWGLVMQLPEVDDDLKLEVLRFRAARRGLEMPEDVGRYIMTRSSRSLVELIAVLEQLDRASMVHQRQLSIPFVKASLSW
jgi:DnaA-homolog protein